MADAHLSPEPVSVDTSDTPTDVVTFLGIVSGVATAVLVTGIVTGDEPTLTVGIVGLGACVVAWPLSRLLLGSEAEPDRPEESDHLDS